MAHRVVIVGSSVGGVRAARALRAEGYQGGITLVGEEPDLPYDRPPLSKQVLTGAWPAERASLLTAQAAADAGIELRLGASARALDLPARLVRLADGESLPYDDLVIATGASARPSPWQPPSGVYQLRTPGGLPGPAEALRRRRHGGDDRGRFHRCRGGRGRAIGRL